MENALATGCTGKAILLILEIDLIDIGTIRVGNDGVFTDFPVGGCRVVFTANMAYVIDFQ
jgi:hypothetical protein